jgi:hypothetical protein
MSSNLVFLTPWFLGGWYRQEDFSWSAVILSSCVLIAASIALYALARHVTYSFIRPSITFIHIYFLFIREHGTRANRTQLEATSRLLFLWQHQVEEQSERAADLRRRNQVLLFSVFFCQVCHTHAATRSAGRIINPSIITSISVAGRRLYCVTYYRHTSPLIF